MAGGIIILLYYAFVGVLFAGAGLVDLLLLPFRPLMPTTYYVDTLAVTATRLASRAPVHAGHYLITPPSPGDWYRITALNAAAQPQGTGLESAPYRGARELFIRSPTARRPSAVRTLADSPIVGQPPNHVPGAPPRGRTEPAAYLEVNRLEAGDGDVRAGLARFIDVTRAGPAWSGPLSTHAGRYQVARHEQSFARVGGMPCLRDEFVYLWLEHPTRKSKVSRHLAFTLACADAACPGQVVSLVVRGKVDSGGDLERQARSFLDDLGVDPAVEPVCAAR